MRRRFWWVHKYYRGEFKASIRVPGNFETVDKWTVEENRRYGNLGWGYEISAYEKPVQIPNQCEPQAPIEPVAATL